MQAVKRFFNKHYYAFCFYGFMLIYYFGFAGAINGWKADDVSLAYHSVDFSMGFCSKLLTGSIYNLFFDSVSIFKISVYEIVLLLIFYFAACLILEKFLLSISGEYRKTAAIVIFFFLAGPSTLSGFAAELGTLDVYWIFATVLFFLTLTCKRLYILTVPIILATVMVHYAGIMCYAPMMAILLLYRAACCEKTEKAKGITVFLTAAISAIALSLYFIAFEKDNVTYSLEEFNKILLSRGASESCLEFYEYGFYRETGDEAYNLSGDYSGVSGFFAVIGQQILTTLTILKNGMVSNGHGVYAIYVLMLLLPVAVFIEKALWSIIKQNKENKLKVFSILCMMLLPLLTWVGGLLMSTDLIRWINNAFMPLFLSFLFVLYTEGESAWSYVKTKTEGIPKGLMGTYGLVYLVSLFDPYGG